MRSFLVVDDSQLFMEKQCVYIINRNQPSLLKLHSAPRWQKGLLLETFTPLSTGLPTALQNLAHTQSWPFQTAGASTSLRSIGSRCLFQHQLGVLGLCSQDCLMRGLCYYKALVYWQIEDQSTQAGYLWLNTACSSIISQEMAIMSHPQL